MKHWMKGIFALVLLTGIVSVVAVSCSDDDDETSTTGGTVKAADVTGTYDETFTITSSDCEGEGLSAGTTETSVSIVTSPSDGKLLITDQEDSTDVTPCDISGSNVICNLTTEVDEGVTMKLSAAGTIGGGKLDVKVNATIEIPSQDYSCKMAATITGVRRS